MMNQDTKTLVKAIGQVLKERLNNLPPGKSARFELAMPAVNNVVETPSVNVAAPNVNVSAPAVSVTVDMTPVAQAIDRMTDAVLGQGEMLSQLLQVLASQPAPAVTVKPRFDAPESDLSQRFVEQLAQAIVAAIPAKPKRMVIKHDDGKVSVVEAT